MILPEEICINSRIAEIIESHGYKTYADGEKIIPNFKEKVKIQTWVYPYPSEENIITQFDIGFEFENGLELYECFGDIGKSLEEAIYANIESFCQSSLHTILDAFNDKEEFSEVEKWENSSGARYRAFIGNYFTKKESVHTEVNIPDNLLEEIKNCLLKYQWDEDYYFIRFYYSFDGFDEKIEFMINNIQLEEEENHLKELNWEKTEDFYSIRNFIILKRIHNP